MPWRQFDGPTQQVDLVTTALETDIRSGRLAPGTLLPTHRQLAAERGIAIASATKVYARLKSMGLVVGETGRGTFVRDRPPTREWDASDEARRSTDALELSFNQPQSPGQAEHPVSSAGRLRVRGKD